MSVGVLSLDGEEKLETQDSPDACSAPLQRPIRTNPSVKRLLYGLSRPRRHDCT